LSLRAALRRGVSVSRSKARRKRDRELKSSANKVVLAIKENKNGKSNDGNVARVGSTSGVRSEASGADDE
jgi:hypothetical protein